MNKNYTDLENSFLGEYLKQGYLTLIYDDSVLLIGTLLHLKNMQSIEDSPTEEQMIKLLKELYPQVEIEDKMEPVTIETKYLSTVIGYDSEEGGLSVFFCTAYNRHEIEAHRLSE